VGDPLEAEPELPADFEDRLAGESFESLPLLADHTRGVASMPWHHRDPFDRLLIAQAQAAALTLVTADQIAARYGDFILLVR
jgi:PIN domain nuclease of toxin-antitoxin system